MQRKVLIVDDNALNRHVLRGIICREYEVLEATNGRDALEKLNQSYSSISAVLLDIFMPEMDGYELLEIMRGDANLAQIPVIVTTGNTGEEAEVKALALGANDYIEKPYNPAVISHRLFNTIKLRETAAVANAARYDELTGLLNRNAFFELAAEKIASKPPGYYVMTCFDIDNFKVINDQYGSAKGDEILKKIADVFKKGFGVTDSLCCRMTADNFANMYPYSFMGSEEIAEIRRQASHLDGSILPLSYSVGRYIIDDLSLPVSAMFDRASIAESKAKGRFDKHITLYDESMREHILREQDIANEMNIALEQHQFEAWLQPLYNHSTGALIGAEALARWRHPQRGMIYPGEFIPVFERNGFIYELDKYICEQACILLRKWLDEGLTPLPLSANISRYDLFRDDIVDVITGLVRKYDIPEDLLRLEITESAFSNSADRIMRMVKRLIERGFTIEIDDFGSGYSSLNTLKDVPAQVLKLDMRFLEDDNNSQRGGNILESVVRMAKWLNMSVIAEGVETVAQAEYLKSIGCNYVQGYLYAKPMPVSNYETLLRGEKKEAKLSALKTVENLDNNAFWDPNSMETLIFNSYVGGACIFEYHKSDIELLRATEKFARIINEGMSVGDVLKLEWKKHLDEENANAMHDAIQKSMLSKDEETLELVFLDLPGCPRKTYLRVTLRVIASAGDRHLIYCTNENITAQRQAEHMERETAKRLQTIMDNVNSGIVANVIDGDAARFIFANDRYYEMLGYTREQYESEFVGGFGPIAPEDKPRVLRRVKDAFITGEPFTLQYRAIRRDGKEIWLRQRISITAFEGVDSAILLSVLEDITSEKRAEKLLLESDARLQAIINNVNGGVSAITLSGDTPEHIFTNNRYYSMLGYTKAQYDSEIGSNSLAFIHPDDRDAISDIAHASNTAGCTSTIEFRAIRRDGRMIWIRSNSSVCNVEGIDKPVHISVFNDITGEKESELKVRMLNENLQKLMNDTPGGFARMRIEPNGNLSMEYVNERFCKLRGKTGAEILANKDSLSSVHPDDVGIVRAAIEDMLTTSDTLTLRFRLKHGEHDFVRVQVYGRVTQSLEGETFVNAYFASLSEQEKTSLSVRDTMPFILSAIMKSSTDLAFAKDKDFNYICCSPAFARFAGQADDTGVIGKSDYELFPKETADQFRRDDLRIFESGESITNYIEPIPSQDGTPHYSNTSKYILRDALNNVVGLYGLGRDITEYQNAYERLKLLTNSISGGLAMYEIGVLGDVHLLYFNDGFYNITGYTREEYYEFVKHDAIALILDEDKPNMRKCIKAMLEGENSINIVHRTNCKGGGYRWVDLSVSVVERREDRLLANAVKLDVTDKKLAEEAAKLHLAEMETAMSKLGRIICEYDVKTRTLVMPEFYAAEHGVPHILDNIPDRIQEMCAGYAVDATGLEELFNAILRGEPAGSAELNLPRLDGSLHWERYEFSGIFDEKGKPVKAIIAVDDTTEQHQRYELEQNRPMLGDENLIGHALFNLTTRETLEYFNNAGRPLPVEEQLIFTGSEKQLNYALIDPGERQRFSEMHNVDNLLTQYAKGVTEHSIEYRRRLKSGEVIWVRNILKLMPKPGASDVLMFEYCYGIDDEKTLELMCRSLVDMNYDFVVRISADTRNYVTLGNRSVMQETPLRRGIDADVDSAKLVERNVHPDDVEMVRYNISVAGMKRNLESANRFQFTCRHLLSDGSIAYKKYTQYYLDKERDILILIREDITELMREEMRKNELLENALRAANEESRVKEREAAVQLKAIMNNVNGGMSAATLVDGEISYVYINEQYYTMFGYTEEQFHSELPRGLFNIIHPDDLQTVFDGAAASEASGNVTMEFRVYKRDGSLMWVRAISSASEVTGVEAPVHIAVLSDITKEREAADRLRLSEEQFRIAAVLGGRDLARYDIKTRTYYNDSEMLYAMGFGKEIENVPQAFIDAGIVEPNSIDDTIKYFEAIRRGEQNCSVNVAMRVPDGSFRWFRSEATVVFDADNKPLNAILVFFDITEQREKEAAYRRWQQSIDEKQLDSYTLVLCNLNRDLSTASIEGSLLDIPEGELAITFNEQTLKYASESVVLDDRDKFITVVDSDRLLTNFYRGIRSETLEYREIQPHNAYRWLRLNIELVEYPHTKDVMGYMLFEDIDAAKRAELLSKKRAETDSLTGVFNRATFAQAVDRMIEHKPTGQMALMLLDVDGFKLLNDTFGHAAGDKMLIDMAETLRSILRNEDLLGRLGGDEFLICLNDMPDDAAIEKKARQICEMLHRSLSLEVYISASVGIAVYPRDGTDFESLYHKMDMALYAVKGAGKDNFAFYREGMTGNRGESEPPEPIAGKPKRRLLIVEDSRMSLMVLSEIFKDEFTIETAEDGNTALMCLRRYGTGISAVLLDLMLPGMDGFAVLEKMRGSAEMQSIPVVVVSASDERDISLKAIRCGATDYVSKPVDAELIRLRVRSAISRSENERLRAQNSFLLMQNEEVAKYRMALDSAGAFIVGFNAASRSFACDPSTSQYLAGDFDGREFLEVLTDDGVAEPGDIDKLNALKNLLIEGGTPSDTMVSLKTPANDTHIFRVSTYMHAGGAFLVFVDVSIGSPQF